MDAIEQLKQDVRDGRIGVDRLIDVIEMQHRQLQSAHRRIEELEKKAGGTGTAKVDEPFSMRSEEKRQQARRKNKKTKLSKKGRRGRLTSADKLKLAERTEKVFPDGVPPQDCQLSHTRPVWRLENGRAVLIAYQIYRGKNQYGKIPGMLGRSEFSLEIMVEIAYFVYVVGLSFETRFVWHCSSCKICRWVKRRPTRCCNVCHGTGSTSSMYCVPCWPTRWWCMPTKRVGASTACGPFFQRKHAWCFLGFTRMRTPLRRFSIHTRSPAW